MVKPDYAQYACEKFSRDMLDEHDVYPERYNGTLYVSVKLPLWELILSLGVDMTAPVVHLAQYIEVARDGYITDVYIVQREKDEDLYSVITPDGMETKPMPLEDAAAIIKKRMDEVAAMDPDEFSIKYIGVDPYREDEDDDSWMW